MSPYPLRGNPNWWCGMVLGTVRIYNHSYRGCIPTYVWLLLPWLHPTTTLTAPPCQAHWALLARSEQHVQLSLWWSRSRRGVMLSLSKVRRTGKGHRALGPSLQLDSLILKPTHGPWLFSSLSPGKDTLINVLGANPLAQCKKKHTRQQFEGFPRCGKIRRRSVSWKCLSLLWPLPLLADYTLLQESPSFDLAMARSSCCRRKSGAAAVLESLCFLEGRIR